MTKDVLATESVFFAWNNGAASDQAMLKDGKACLWLPGGQPLGRVDIGYSAQMNTDKCGEIPFVEPLSAHSVNSTIVNPYLNIARSDLQIEKNTSQLKLTHNGASALFAAQQPITVYGTGTKRIQVSDGADVQHLTLRNLNIPLTASQDYAPISVEGAGKLTLYLSGKNRLQGASKSGSVTAGIRVAPEATLTIQNDDAKDEQQNGMGELYVKGGANINDAAAGIGGNHGLVAGNIIINGGTIQAEGGMPTLWGIGDGKGAIGGHKPVIIKAGSVNTRREWTTATQPHPFKNSSDHSVYLITINTGLTPNKKYICTYFECNPEPFPVQTDEYGKCYFWMPKRTQLEKPEATFRDPATNNTTTIQLVKVDENDKNVAPIVAELVQEGQPVEYHNNLKDAFDAVRTANATIRLLIDIDNLSSMQTVKSGKHVTLDLDRFNLDTKNSKEAGFNAEVGGYLFITGEGESGTGNIKSTFKIGGDIYIAGLVPLTDATPLQNEKAVFRTLVKGLPESASNIYTYSYGSISNRTFYLHDGQACLWLPDGSGELTFRVTQGSNVTDYTAGTITTNTQRTEAITSQPVGVVARVVKGENVEDFNNLPGAFAAAATTPGNTVLLLANIALTKPTTVDGNNDFTLDLNGMGLTGATGTTLSISPSRYLTITDSNAGVKGSVSIDVILNGRLFVSGNINVKGNVTRTANNVWRTMVDVSNLAPIPGEVKQGEVISKVVNREACFWMAEDKSQSFTFNANATDYTVTGVNIHNNHLDNLVTLGVGNDEAQITGKSKYSTFTAAWTAAAEGDEIVLLKDATLPATLTLTGKKVQIDVARYSLSASTESASLTIGSDATLIVKSGNGNGRMLVPVVNSGLLYIGQSVQADRLSSKITNGSGDVCWRTLVTSLPEGMPDDGVYNYTFASQSGSFYVKDKTACLWLQPEMAQKMAFPQFNSSTDNVTVEQHHANQVIWGQSFVAQVQNKMYTELNKAFSENSNQTVTLLKSAVLGTSQTISTQMKLEMGGYSISPQGTPAPGFEIASGGSLQVTGKGSISTNFKIDFASPTHGSNANLTIASEINMNIVNVIDKEEAAYYRTTVTLPAGVKGLLTYNYGAQTGQAYAVDGQPLTLWLVVPDAPQDMKLTQGQDSWIATAVKITGTHVNPVTVQSINDEASILGSGGSTVYYKTLSDAFAAATAGQQIMLERDLNNVGGTQVLGTGITGQVELNLKGLKLTATDATFDAKDAQLILKNGNLNGMLAIRGNVFAHPDLAMNNTQVSSEGKTVWRTLLTLPAGTTSFRYRLGDVPETFTESKNISDVDGKPIACLWLPSSNMARTLTVKAGIQEYALNNIIIASTHGNELDITSDNQPVAECVGVKYASLASALASAKDGETIKLLKDLSLSTVQDVKTSVTLDLAGKNLTSSNGGFNVGNGKTLKLANGGLVGTIRLIGEGATFAEKSVKVVGLVLNAKNEELYRVLVTMATTPDATLRCLWLKSAALEYDYLIIESDNGVDTPWEVTIPAKLSNHNEELTAHRRIEFTANTDGWKSDYTDANIVLKPVVVWTLPAGLTAATIHRLTLHDGARVTIPSSSQVTAEEGIRYIRTFNVASVWESIALPFSTTRVTAEKTPGKVSLLTPASGTGTAGDFWLYTMQVNGQQIPVNSEQMEANEAYIMAVPTALAGKEITFVSAPRQVLRRNQVQAVVPVSGFASYANGTLDEITVKDRCYVLNDLGTVFQRKEINYTLKPFRGYLLADMATTNNTPELRMGIVTDVPEIAADAFLVVRSLPGRLLVDSSRETWLSVYTFTGYPIYQRRIPEGHTEIPLEQGAYIVNGQKLFVR